MKTQIRKGVFETNSSSTHSIIIATDPAIKAKPSEIYFNGGEFGWECEEYHDTETKASYLYTAMVYTADVYDESRRISLDEKIQWISSVLGKNGIDCEFEELVDKPCEYGERKEKGETYKDFDRFCYIDHGYELTGPDSFMDYIFDSEENLLNYLLSEDSFIITGNDNGDEYDAKREAALKSIGYDYVEIYKGN